MWLEPDGPKPIFLVTDEDPYLDVWEGNEVPNGHVAVGVKEAWGLKPGFTHAAIQGRD